MASAGTFREPVVPGVPDVPGVPARTALIVGAGIGGLAAAIALRRRGWQARVFERAASPRELGFALNLAPNALAALRELGLADRLIAEGHVPESAEIRHADGRVIRRLSIVKDLGAGSAPSMVALRPALHGALLDAAETENIVLASEAAGFELAGNGVTLRLRDGRTVTGDVLVGADGVGSVIRSVLHPREPAPRASGYFAVRGVAHDGARHLGGISAALYLGRGIEAAIARANQAGAVYWYMSLLAEDVLGTAGDRAVVDRQLARLDATFRAVAHETTGADLRVEELFERDPIAAWGRGAVTLLGDAAHPMLPHTGQGAAQALEDAVALGLALGKRGDAAAALRRYEQVRALRTRRIVKLGRRIVRFSTTKSPVINSLRTAALHVLPTRAMVKTFFQNHQTDPHRELR